MGFAVLEVASSVRELAAIVVIVLVPLAPVTFLAWRFLGGRRSPRDEEIESGRSTATPFAVVSVVGTAIAVVAVLVLLLVVAVRAIAV